MLYFEENKRFGRKSAYPAIIIEGKMIKRSFTFY